MIKARIMSHEKPGLLLGLTRENVKRLMDDQPIHITREQLREMGLPDGMDIVLIGGETEGSISQMLGGLNLTPEVAGQKFTLKRPS